MSRLVKNVCLGALCLALGGLPSVWAQGPALTPVQLAFVKAETKKADDLFVQRVAIALRVDAARVREALPSEKRITDRMARLISALEKDLKRTLTDEEKAAITSAEDERKKAIANAQRSASGN
jgi:hypothetical protein